MPAVSLHGLTIAWSVSGLARDPIAEFLGSLQPASEAGATIRFEVEPASDRAAVDPRTEGWEPSFFHGIVEAHHGPRGFLVWDRASRVLVPRDGGTIEAHLATPDREVVHGSLKTVLQVTLALAVRPTGLFNLHAAALVLPSGVPVLVVGASGAGKTSTTIALLEGEGRGTRGADYLGDDTLFIARRAEPAGALDLVAFPREFHLGEATLRAAPRLEPLLGPLPAYGAKRPLDARRAYPGRFRPLLALAPDTSGLALFPSVASAPETELVPLARASAFGYLLASSGAIVCDGIPGREENLALLGALLGAVRCYEIRLGADALEDPARAIAARVAAMAADARDLTAPG